MEAQRTRDPKRLYIQSDLDLTFIIIDFSNAVFEVGDRRRRGRAQLRRSLPLQKQQAAMLEAGASRRRQGRPRLLQRLGMLRVLRGGAPMARLRSQTPRGRDVSGRTPHLAAGRQGPRPRLLGLRQRSARSRHVDVPEPSVQAQETDL